MLGHLRGFAPRISPAPLGDDGPAASLGRLVLTACSPKAVRARVIGARA